jgi:aspartyl-tRNA(Asn)/glutamyl-tRNA(Gln) amidotransferase subunit A
MIHQQITDTSAIHYQEATALAALIRTKQLSSREVVQAHLDRVHAVNPQINAVVTVMAEQALTSADAADRAVAAGAPLGPLHGVPFSIKDALETGGVLTQRGSKLFAGNIPDKDATAVARFKASGGIPLMKSNLPEFSAWTDADNRVTGRTNNPWNLERPPGGSSGGESAALAAGMSPIGIGSDLMISVRGPAAFTGVAALKATHGRVPYTGQHDPRRGPGLLDPEGAGRARRLRDSRPDAQADGGGLAGQPIRVGWVSDAAFAPRLPQRPPSWPISDARWRKWRCLSLAIASARWLLLPGARSCRR